MIVGWMKKTSMALSFEARAHTYHQELGRGRQPIGAHYNHPPLLLPPNNPRT